MAISVLARTGKSPSTVLLSIMGIATFSSMWISNVAAPVLCFSISKNGRLYQDFNIRKCVVDYSPANLEESTF
jgi:di/tricarboxylate transporter